MIKTDNHTIYENDIEDWMWNNPGRLWVGGWLNRQLTIVANGRLDLLGWSTFANGLHHCLELVEIKATPIKHEHISQIESYEYWLRETIRRLGLIEIHVRKTLVVTSRDINKTILSCANNSGTQIRQVTFDDQRGFEISEPLDMTKEFYLKVSVHKDRLIRSGRFDNLINFMVPLMPDFIQDEYKYHEVTNGTR